MNRVIHRTVLYALASLLALQVSSVLAAEDAGLIELVKAGTLSRSRSVTSFKGTVKISTWSLGSQTGGEQRSEKTISVACQAPRFRMCCEAVEESGLKYEAAFDGVKLTEWQKTGLFNPPVRISAGLTGLPYGDFNLFLNPHNLGNTDLSDSEDMKLAGRETVGGDDCIVAELKASSAGGFTAKRRAWVSVDKGFTVVRCESVVTSDSTGQVVTREVIVSDMQSYGGTVWGPLRQTRTSYAGDGTKTREMVVVYDPTFKFNVPISEDELKLVLPSGIEVSDGTLDAEYIVP